MTDSPDILITHPPQPNSIEDVKPFLFVLWIFFEEASQTIPIHREIFIASIWNEVKVVPVDSNCHAEGQSLLIISAISY